MQNVMQQLATKSLCLWDMPKDATAVLINVSENHTFLVEASDGFKAVLRIHRQSYHSERSIESELEWISALRQTSPITTPEFHKGRNGHVVQSGEVDRIDGPHFMVLFTFVDGHHPDETQNPLALYQRLGGMAASCHRHAVHWVKPEGFTRLSWDQETIFGPDAHWGNWRQAPNVTQRITEILERVENKIHQRLTAYGKSPDRFGLIHADMRFANLLVDGDTTNLIDFDDCGFSWFMYDFASTVSFIEDHPEVANFKQAWLRGYRQVRSLSEADEAEIDTFIMLRRMALLAWIGSHMDSTEPKALAPTFARVTADVGTKYLAKFAA